MRDLSLRFGGIVALDNLSFEITPGELCGVIGPNGAGKTTLFNCLTRIYAQDSGTIDFEGRPLNDIPSHRIAGLGIQRTFQHLALFNTMSVLENVLVGGHTRTRSGYVANFLRLPSVAREERALRVRAEELIEMLDLGAITHTPVRELAYGIQKRVDLARALAGDPRLLLLDEPAAGLNHEEVEELRRLILEIRDRFRLTVLLVEHDMSLVMSVCDRIIALDFGRKIAQGTPLEIQNHPDVIRAYLGLAA